MNKKSLKMLVPMLIFAVIIGIYFIKNLPQQEASVDSTNFKFPLTIASVDLASLQEHKMAIIIDFGADSCIPCKEMAPILRKLNAEMQDTAIIQFVDVWKNPQAAQGFPVQVIPTQFFYTADGKPYVPSKNIDELNLEFTLYSDKEGGKHLFTVHLGGLNEEEMRAILQDMQENTAQKEASAVIAGKM